MAPGGPRTCHNNINIYTFWVPYLGYRVKQAQHPQFWVPYRVQPAQFTPNKWYLTQKMRLVVSDKW